MLIISFSCSYTWKIYANKLVNMGNIYTFWRQVNKEQKEAKQRYIHMFYNFLFKNLVSQCLVFYKHTHITDYCIVSFRIKIIIYNTCDTLMSQVKNVPIPSDEPPKPVGKQPSLKQQGSRYVTQSILF